MSDKETGSKPGRRSAVVLMGGLAAGAVLGATLGAAALAAEQNTSISEQFTTAFTPGVAQVEGVQASIVVGES